MPGFDAIKGGVCVAVPASVAACTVTCPSTEIGVAARHAYSDDAFMAGPASLHDRWIENPRLDEFLRTKIQSAGLASMSRRYDLQCTARPASEGCSDCSLCTASFAGKAILMTGIFAPYSYCGDYGQVSVRAEIGPSDTVKSMTYWAVPPRVKRE
jgi:hypothetical protein